MNHLDGVSRRRFLGRIVSAFGAFGLAGCDRLSQTDWFPKVLGSAERLNDRVATLVTGRKAMAQEFPPAAISPTFRSNGTADPDNPQYAALAANHFADYALEVTGLVAAPRKFTLDELRALPSRTQITRHDCVEGWSAIGKWQGARLSALLDVVKPTSRARFVVFHCADPMNEDGTSPYYESIDMDDAYHVQTILAYALNDGPLPIKNGAPIRLRVERQLGYKHAKYVMRLELVESFAHIGEGHGGYWEDQGYQWYAGV
ncbi:MAG TPA: molybdopterin-binding protein [Casimicrobiaceae bacterium]|nr:molybdopterin-binding protein [Casimicrobiaceae bacterium]